jgi:hypothetical protein
LLEEGDTTVVVVREQPVSDRELVLAALDRYDEVLAVTA